MRAVLLITLGVLMGWTLRFYTRPSPETIVSVGPQTTAMIQSLNNALTECELRQPKEMLRKIEAAKDRNRHPGESPAEYLKRTRQ